MNNQINYIKAHYFNSSSAAIALVKKHCSEKNVTFAEKVLKDKIAAADKIYHPTTAFRRLKSERTNKLIDSLQNIENIKEEIAMRKNAPLYKIDMEYDQSTKDLRDYNFSHINYTNKTINQMREVDFSKANLSGCDMTKAHLEGSHFRIADLTDAKLTINLADFHLSKLDRAIIRLDLPQIWSPEKFDRLLNANNSQ